MRTNPDTCWCAALAVLAACAAGCNSDDRSSVTREPVAKAVPVVPVAGPSKSAPKAEAKPDPAPAPTVPEADGEPPVEAPPEHADEPDAPPAEKRAKKKASTDAPSSGPRELALKRLVVTTAIEHREPVATSMFRAGNGPIIAFVELVNPSDEPEQISISFESDAGRKVGDVELEIPAHSRRWRTWGRTRLIRQPGSWTAVVKDSDGDVLARQTFVVAK